MLRLKVAAAAGHSHGALTRRSQLAFPCTAIPRSCSTPSSLPIARALASSSSTSGCSSSRSSGGSRGLGSRGVVCAASKQSSGAGDEEEEVDEEEKRNRLLYTIGMGILWLSISVYGFMLSPNQTPTRDMIFLKLLVGLREPGENFMVNQVYTALFNIMGIWPAVYAGLLVPAGRSANKLPAWPFIAGSFGFGVFALLPYFTFWRPIKEQQLPPPKEELEGWNKLLLKGTEGRVLPALLVAGALGMYYLAATAGGQSWLEYGRLIDESRLVHVTTLDFLCLSALAPFWMSNDAEGRDWEQRDQLLPVLSVLPCLGPAIYLLLRPKAEK